MQKTISKKSLIDKSNSPILKLNLQKISLEKILTNFFVI